MVDADLDVLIGQLRGASGRRSRAVAQVVERGEPAMAYVLARLRDGDAPTRAAIAGAFTGDGWPATVYQRTDVADALLATLADEHPPARRRAARALRLYCEPRAAPVMAAWLGSADEAERYIGQVGLYQAGVAGHCRSVEDASVQRRRAAVEALVRCYGHGHTAAKIARRFVADPDDEVRGHAARYLGAHGGLDAVALLYPVLSDDRAGLWTRLRALDAVAQVASRLGTAKLLSHRPGLLDAAATAMGSTAAIVRSHAVAAVAALGGPRAPGLLASALGDPDGGVRAAGVAALVRLRAPDALDVVCRLLREDPDHAVREDAALALAELAGTTAAGALRTALDDPHVQVRTAAGRSLAVLDGTA